VNLNVVSAKVPSTAAVFPSLFPFLSVPLLSFIPPRYPSSSAAMSLLELYMRVRLENLHSYDACQAAAVRQVSFSLSLCLCVSLSLSLPLSLFLYLSLSAHATSLPALAVLHVTILATIVALFVLICGLRLLAASWSISPTSTLFLTLS